MTNKTAEERAQEVGKKVIQIFRQELLGENVPDGAVYYIIRDTLKAHGDSERVAALREAADLVRKGDGVGLTPNERAGAEIIAKAIEGLMEDAGHE